MALIDQLSQSQLKTLFLSIEVNQTVWILKYDRLYKRKVVAMNLYAYRMKPNLMPETINHWFEIAVDRKIPLFTQKDSINLAGYHGFVFGFSDGVFTDEVQAKIALALTLKPT